MFIICVSESAKRLFFRCERKAHCFHTVCVSHDHVLCRCSADKRKPHTNEVSFVNICMFWVGGGVATQGIPSSRRRSKAAFFNQLRPWASASFISIYIHPSGIFIYAKSRLRPFDHGAILDHPHVTVGPGHQHGCDEDKESSLQWRQSQRVRGRAADCGLYLPALRSVHIKCASKWQWPQLMKLK